MVCKDNDKVGGCSNNGVTGGVGCGDDRLGFGCGWIGWSWELREHLHELYPN